MGRVASNNTGLGQRGRLLGAALALVLLNPSTAFPDAGRLQGSGRSGPFVLSLYTAPVPLRSGAVEISTLVTNAENGEPVLDATVQVQLQREGGPAPATTLTASRGGDGLRYFAAPELREPGRWSIRAKVSSPLGTGSLERTVAVEEPAPFYVSLWPVLAFPPLGIALFALHQRLRARMRRVSRRASGHRA